MSKRKDVPSVTPRTGAPRSGTLDEDEILLPGAASETKVSTENVNVEFDTDFILDALDGIRDFAEYHVLPMAEHLTVDHLTAFLEAAQRTS